MNVLDVLNQIDSFVWGPPLLILLVGTGILLTYRLRLLQIFQLKKALSLIFSAENKGSGDIDSFKALCTALAATVVILLGLLPLLKPVVRELFSGCGLLLSSVWQLSMRKAV